MKPTATQNSSLKIEYIRTCRIHLQSRSTSPTSSAGYERVLVWLLFTWLPGWRVPCNVTRFNSLRPGDALVHLWIGSSLVQVMTCRLFSAKPLPEPVLLIKPLRICLKKIVFKYILLLIKGTWKCRLQSGDHIFQASVKDFGAWSRYLGHGQDITSHRILWDVITYPCPRYLLLAPKSSIVFKPA